MRLAEDEVDWVVGFLDECWWSRVAQPNLHSFERSRRASASGGAVSRKRRPRSEGHLLLRLYVPELAKTWLRFVDGRPVSAISAKRFSEWCSEKLAAIGKKVWVLIWDNASWHISREVRRWIGRHNREVKVSGCGVRIVTCLCCPRRVRGSTRSSPSGSTANARWSNPTDCSTPTSWQK
jgi:hypothetical protein